ncbi:hypothetical protein BC830DRAFT_1131227 [Chytriomyces sp. MP71]|nr:hypothetical protein BC830DRAFT_1131227 [Chytriomyces sp. MP71]
MPKQDCLPGHFFSKKEDQEERGSSRCKYRDCAAFAPQGSIGRNKMLGTQASEMKQAEFPSKVFDELERRWKLVST